LIICLILVKKGKLKKVGRRYYWHTSRTVRNLSEQQTINSPQTNCQKELTTVSYPYNGNQNVAGYTNMMPPPQQQGMDFPQNNAPTSYPYNNDPSAVGYTNMMPLPQQPQEMSMYNTSGYPNNPVYMQQPNFNNGTYYQGTSNSPAFVQPGTGQQYPNHQTGHPVSQGPIYQ